MPWLPVFCTKQQQKTTATICNSPPKSGNRQPPSKLKKHLRSFSMFFPVQPFPSHPVHGLPSSSSLSKTWRKQIFPSSCAASGDNETRQPMTFRIRVPASKPLQQSAQLPKSQKKLQEPKKKAQ
jgi:hypothetical protein